MDKLFNFDNCKEGFKRYGGSDKKDTIIIDNTRFMIKYNNIIDKNKQTDFTSNSRNNVFSEYISCRIIKTLGIPVQNTYLGLRKGHVVVACEDFCTDGNELNEFEKYGNSIDLDFENCRYPEIRDVIDVIRRNKQMDPEIIEKRFWDTFCIDALLGNFDRHTGNWGYLFNEELSTFDVAPIYDCGACLYPMINDEGMLNILNNEKEIEERIYKYPKAAFFNNNEKIDYYLFLNDPKTLEEYPILRSSIKNICDNLNLEKVRDIIKNTPGLTSIRTQFYERMINERYNKILSPSLALVNAYNTCKQMENTWYDFFSKPKEERKSITWQGKSFRIAVFEDMYMNQCKKDSVSPDLRISEHFWSNCVNKQGYKPQFCSLSENIEL